MSYDEKIEKERAIKLEHAKALREYAEKLELQVEIQDNLNLEYDKEHFIKDMEEELNEYINYYIKSDVYKEYSEKYNIAWALENPIKVTTIVFERKED